MNDPVQQSLLSDYTPVRARPSVFAGRQIADNLGGLMGPLVFGLLAWAIGWRAPLILVAVLYLTPRFGLAISIGVIGLFVLIESILRGGVVGLLATWIRFLAIVATVILLVNYWQLALIVAVIAAGVFILRANVGELLDTAREQ